jgi:hypothetical protein
MSTLTIGEFEVPFDAATLAGFRAWSAMRSDGGPLVSFVDGCVCIDVTNCYETHAPVTTAVNGVLGGLAHDDGMYFLASSWFTNEDANLSVEPDGFFVRYETLRAGHFNVNPMRNHEALGRPDFVFEAVSPSTKRKDLVQLVDAYARAGIPEYWLIDARGKTLVFRTLVLEDGAYIDVPVDADGWRVSPTWGRAFRLRRITNPAGLPEYRLDVR